MSPHTRIAGGESGGRRLVTPAGPHTRPTSEKVRAAMASALTAAGALDGARVLDLYAGSGALGLELVSRGASTAVFVESDRAALAALRANVAALASPRVELVIVASDVGAFLRTRAGPLGPFDVVVADPPYATPSPDVAHVLERLREVGALGRLADVVVERGARDVWTWPDGFTEGRRRRHGDTLLLFGQAP